MGGIGWWSPLVNGAGGGLSSFVGGGGVCAWCRVRRCSWQVVEGGGGSFMGEGVGTPRRL